LATEATLRCREFSCVSPVGSGNQVCAAMDVPPALWLSRLTKAWCNLAIILCWVLGSQPAPQHPSFPSPTSPPLLDPQLLSAPTQSVPADPFPQTTFIQPFRPSTISTTHNPGDNLPQSPPAPAHQGVSPASSLLGPGTLQC